MIKWIILPTFWLWGKESEWTWSCLGTYHKGPSPSLTPDEARDNLFLESVNIFSTA
jgi:hypothetical protein